MSTLDAYRLGKKIRAQGWSVRRASETLSVSTATAGRAVQVYDFIRASPARLHETYLDLTLTRIVALSRLTPALALEALGGALGASREVLLKRVRMTARKKGRRPRAEPGRNRRGARKGEP